MLFRSNRVCGSRQVVLVRVAEIVVVIPVTRGALFTHTLHDPLEVTTIATVTVLGTVIYERRITVIVTIAIVQRTDTIEVVPRTQNRNTMIRKAISLERLETFWMADIVS